MKSKDIYKNQKGTLAQLSGKGDGFYLEDYQIVNHFYNHSFITSKVGLTNSLKELPFWNNSKEPDAFYPMCFVVPKNFRFLKNTGKKDQAGDDPSYEWDIFRDYFRVIWAESILKRFFENGKCCLEKVLVALHISERRMMTLDD